VGHFGDELFAPLYQALEAGEGFTPARARATVFGVCRQCRDHEAPARGRR
jgi:Fe2+ or Zn2+ uptake regulation protein